MEGVIPYFPRITFFYRAVLEGQILVCPTLMYDKQFHANRMVIPGSNGLISLSIPVSGGRNVKLPIDQVKIDNTYHWQRDHFRTLSSVYGKSPFFIFYEPELKLLMLRRFEYLYEWNMACLKWTLSKLKSKQVISIRESFEISFEKTPKTGKHNSKVENADYPSVHFRYNQLFEDRIGFCNDVSVLDLLFNLGPDAYQKISELIV